MWKKPSSLNLTMLIDILNQADTPYSSSAAPTTTPHCSRCGQPVRPDTTHRLLTCPTVADIWNDVERQVATILDKHYTTSDAVNTTHCRAKQISASYTLSTLGQPPSAHRTPSNSTLQKISLMMAHEETRRATHHIREEYEQAQNTKRTQIAQSKADLLAFQAHLRTILHATHTAVAECLTILGEIPARDTHGKVIAEMTLRRHLPL